MAEPSPQPVVVTAKPADEKPEVGKGLGVESKFERRVGTRKQTARYCAEKLPTGMGPGPLTEDGTSSTQVLPGASGI